MSRVSVSILVVVSMLFGLCGMAQASLTDIADNPYRDAIENMVELGVFEGRGDGRFWPEANLTRAEAAKVAAYLSGFTAEDAEQARSTDPVFDDVYVGMGPHEWAVGWINLVAREGVIKGYGDGNYHPGETLQMVQWAAILIRILGHETENMAWPAGYDSRADELGLTEGLAYRSGAHVNRGEMAKLTATAVNEVVRPDGSTILEALLQRIPEKQDPGPVTSLSVAVSLSPEFVPQGGGKAVTITATVTDGHGSPVPGATVDFFAGSETGDRSAQLSDRQKTTDGAGKAMAVYTTVAADDLRMVEIMCNASTDGVWSERKAEFIAADSAARVTGVVKNPYTGLPVEGVNIVFWHVGLERMVGFTHSDAQGRYTLTVPTGSYNLNFELDDRDMMAVSVSQPGTTYTVNYNKGILKGIVTGLAPGAEVMAIGPGFNPSSPDNFSLIAKVGSDGSFTLKLSPNTYELFVVGRSSPFKTGIVVNSGQATDLGTIGL